jgi:transcription antitermination factor NusG
MDVNNRLPVLTTPGVIGIVGIGKAPVPVSLEEIEAVRAIMQSRLSALRWPYLRTGERVEIVRGPLAGVEGVLVRSKSNYRLVVSVSLLQRSVAVEIDGGWIRSPRPAAGWCEAADRESLPSSIRENSRCQL